MARIGHTLGLVLLFWCFAVCSGGEKGADVQGKVHFQGEPIASGKIAFHYAAGKPFSAPIKKGMYAFKNLPAASVIVTIEGDGIPAKYGSPKTSPLKVELKAGSQNVDLDLQ